MPPKQSEDDVEVRLEDQNAINAFGRLTSRMHDLEDELKEKRSQHELLDDASNEIILADDDEPIRYSFGECHFEVTKDGADELLELQKDRVEAEIKGGRGRARDDQGHAGRASRSSSTAALAGTHPKEDT